MSGSPALRSARRVGRGASPSGGVRAPDFSAVALGVLRDALEPLVADVRRWLERGDRAALDAAGALLDEARDALRLLGRPATACVAGEAADLARAIAAGLPDAPAGIGPEDVARVLVDGCAAVQGAVERLLRPDATDSALPHVALFNDMRAVRGEPLVSDALVLALGIEIPDAGPGPMPDADAVKRSGLARAVRNWFRASGAEEAEAVREMIGTVVDALDTLAITPEEGGGTGRETLVAARIVADALARGELADGGAVRRLFAELERVLSASRTDAPLAALLASLLYYVAVIDGPADGHDGERTRLVARYDLGRVRLAAREVEEGRPGTAVAPPLREFRARLADELNPLRDWLDRGPVRADGRRANRLGARLEETAPALELVGAARSAAAMRGLVAALDTAELASGHAVDAEAGRLTLAEALLELDARLDEDLTGPATRAASPGAEPTLASRLRSIGARDRTRDEEGRRGGGGEGLTAAGEAAAAEAKEACIEEARRRVGVAGESLERVFGPSPAMSDPSPVVGEIEHMVHELRTVGDALAILPLPEASALVDGLADVLTDALDAVPPPAALDRLADLAAAVHFYLEAVSHPGPAGAELLVKGEDAIAELRRDGQQRSREGRTSPVRANASTEERGPAPSPGSKPKLSARDAQAMTVGALDALDRIGTTLAETSIGTAQLGALAEEFDRLRSIGGSAGAVDLERVAVAAGRSVAAAGEGADEAMIAQALPPLRETWAVLPQLIEPLAGGDAGTPVRGLDALLEALGRAGEVESAPGADRTSDLDGTLREVFVEECGGHLDLLEREARAALADGPALPTEAALRALHTLTGSAQTVDAREIAELVRPLQRAAVERRRVGGTLDSGETHRVLTTVEALRRRLGEFARAADDDGEPSLDRIFEDEATDLLERLDAVRGRAPGTAEEHATALGVLHTLKGGARAARRDALAARVHELEAELRSLAPGKGAHVAVGRIARAIAVEFDRSRADGAVRAAPTPPSAPVGVIPSVSDDGDAPAAPAGVPAAPPPVATPGHAATSAPAAVAVPPIRAREDHVTRVPEARYERLLGFAADVVSGQARLQADLERLENVARELEVAAQRWRRLPDASLVLESAAARELVDDVAAVRTMLGEALRAADTDGRRTARAGHALQQELVRARLERISGMTARLGRVVEDAAVQSRRRARFELDGGETTIDGSLARELLPALEHLVRNAVVHGIEPVNVREGAGKPATGTVRVDVRIEGTELAIGVEDDGAGVDLEAVERRRLALGLPQTAELLDTLAAPGLSTLESSDVIGGHGLGIGAARGLVERAGGRLLVSRRDAGVRFELRVPQRVPVQQVLLLRAGIDVALPVNCVREVRAIEGCVPVSLAAMLGHASPAASTHVVALEREGVVREVGVEGIGGYRELVMQPLGPQLASLKRFSGGSTLADGRAVLLLEPGRVFDDAGPAPGTDPSPATVPADDGTGPDTERYPDSRGRPEALVVDDSPTQRAWLSTLLGRAGFAVGVARDGVEALEFLAHRRPQVLLADIDMPRLDGHGLLRALARRRAALHRDGRSRSGTTRTADPPVLVITSRDSPTDREAAFANGAAAFLAKPCDEESLRDALRGCGVQVPDIAID